MKVGDIVRIVKQPSDILPHIVGEVGWIDELHSNGTHAMFHGLKIDGSISGCGTLMLDCLAPELSPDWAEVKRIHDREQAQRLEESEACTKRINARIQEIANKHSVSAEEAAIIHKEIQNAIDNAGY